VALIRINTVIGVDPGAKGGVAVVSGFQGEPFAMARRFRLSDDLDWDRFARGVEREALVLAEAVRMVSVETVGFQVEAHTRYKLVVENVWGIKGQSASASFTFGYNTGVVVGALQARTGLTPVKVVKAKWAAGHKLLGASKNATVPIAKELFGWEPLPGTRSISDGEADAGLIALWGYNNFDAT